MSQDIEYAECPACKRLTDVDTLNDWDGLCPRCSTCQTETIIEEREKDDREED